MSSPRPYCYVSVDLEDYTHATMCDMGLRPRTTGSLTVRGVDRILSVLSELPGSPHITFFTTGQVARDQRDLVSALSRDGHEIGCHGNEHEYVHDLDPTGFADRLCRARGSIEEASGQRILGFRAPNFSIDERCPWAHRILVEAGFVYDSSHVGSAPRSSEHPYDALDLQAGRLYEFPIYSHPVTRKQGLRIGGTYFRLLPSWALLALLRSAIRRGYAPLIYLHPSDAVERLDPVRFHEMKGLKLPTRLGWVVRQYQWSCRTESVSKKLREILSVFPNRGPMRTALPANVAAVSA